MTKFNINEYTYYDKRTKQGFLVYARTEKTANEIIEIVNDQNIYTFVKPRFRRFKRAMLTEIPPYQLETEQFEVVEKQRKNRYTYIAEHGGIFK